MKMYDKYLLMISAYFLRKPDEKQKIKNSRYGWTMTKLNVSSWLASLNRQETAPLQYYEENKVNHGPGVLWQRHIVKMMRVLR